MLRATWNWIPIRKNVLIDSTWGLSTLSWHMQNPLAANFFFIRQRVIHLTSVFLIHNVEFVFKSRKPLRDECCYRCCFSSCSWPTRFILRSLLTWSLLKRRAGLAHATGRWSQSKSATTRTGPLICGLCKSSGCCRSSLFILFATSRS